MMWTNVHQPPQCTNLIWSPTNPSTKRTSHKPLKKRFYALFSYLDNRVNPPAKRMSFEGDIDWEELAIKLIRENKNLKRKIEELEKQGDGAEDWSDRMAPKDSGFPVLLTLCTPRERKILLHKARQKIVGGKWCGSIQGSRKTERGRPAVKYEPQMMKDEERRGERPEKKILPKGEKWERRVRWNHTFYLTHILLVGAGKYPKPFDVASHLCHNNRCCDVEHFLWETQTENIKREVCRKAKECVCGQRNSCRFDCKIKD